MCLGSCIGSCCATCGCECIKACCPSVKSATRLPYLLVMFFSTLLAIILRFYGHPILIDMYVYSYSVCDSDSCLGFGAVYRISFALFIWFMTFGLLMLAQSCAPVDRGYWGLKLLYICMLLVLTWFFPNNFYEVYVHFARVISGIFLFLQILILIDFAISWNKEWTKEGNETMRPYALAAAIGMYAASLVLIVFMFKWFGGKGCDVENFVLSFTIITTLIFSLLALSPAAEGRGGILPASVMALYIHYVAYSALASDPSSCNSLTSTGTVQLIIGLILASLSISYAAWNLATSTSLFGDEEPTGADEQKEIALNKAAASGDLGTGKMADAATTEAKLAEPGAKAETAAPAAASSGEGAAAGPKEKDVEKQAKADVAAEEAEDKPPTANQSARFHFVMAAAAMYMAMILTNWSNFKTGAVPEEQTVEVGEESMWIKIVSQWITALLYIWWLLAPMICKDRDFSDS